MVPKINFSKKLLYFKKNFWFKFVNDQQHTSRLHNKGEKKVGDIMLKIIRCGFLIV